MTSGVRRPNSKYSVPVGSAQPLSIPADIEMRYRPLLDLLGFEHWFAEGRSRKAVNAFVSGQPNQISVPFDEHIFGCSPPPGFKIFHLTVSRRNEVGDLLWLAGSEMS